ncbi:MAG: DUF3786 domain-containing protein [Planctomycetota bacterium]|jgi:hypothetical protein
MSNKTEAVNSAIKLSVEKLKDVNLEERCELLGLSAPENNQLKIKLYKSECVIELPSFEMTEESASNIKPADYLTLLHYLECDFPVEETGELITFRDMPGGQFYWGPFISRSVKPLAGRIGNDLELLKTNLERFDYEPLDLGDFSARVYVVGKIYATLVYRTGDEEFGSTADLLFDSSIKRVFCAEDAAVIGSRICIGLL